MTKKEKEVIEQVLSLSEALLDSLIGEDTSMVGAVVDSRVRLNLKTAVLAARKLI